MACRACLPRALQVDIHRGMGTRSVTQRVRGAQVSSLLHVSLDHVQVADLARWWWWSQTSRAASPPPHCCLAPAPLLPRPRPIAASPPPHCLLLVAPAASSLAACCTCFKGMVRPRRLLVCDTETQSGVVHAGLDAA